MKYIYAGMLRLKLSVKNTSAESFNQFLNYCIEIVHFTAFIFLNRNKIILSTKFSRN